MSRSSRLPSVTSDIPRDLRMFIDRVREVLAESPAVAPTVSQVVQTPIAPIAPTIPVPPAPTGLVAVGQPGKIAVRWTAPGYSGHAHTEVWSAPVDDIRQGSAVGMTPGSTYMDHTGAGVKAWYWVRHVNTANVPGVYNGAAGTFAESLAVEFPEPPPLDMPELAEILDERLAELEDPEFGAFARVDNVKHDLVLLIDGPVAQLRIDHDLLRVDHDLLRVDHDALQSAHNSLQSSHSSLQSSHSSLQSAHNALAARVAALEAS